MSPLRHRVINLEAEAERRWEQSIAERLAVIDGTSVAEQLAWLAETRAERADLERTYRGRRVSVAEIVRELAADAGLDEHETAQAIAEAERCLERLREGDG